MYDAYYYDSALNNNTEQRKREISARLATIQWLKGNVQFREVKAEECNCLQCITIRDEFIAGQNPNDFNFSVETNSIGFWLANSTLCLVDKYQHQKILKYTLTLK